MKARKTKQIPVLRTEADAESFVAKADLTQYDLSGFKPMRFEIARKESALNLRIPTGLLEAVKAKAASKNIPYARYVRMLLEADVVRL